MPAGAAFKKFKTANITPKRRMYEKEESSKGLQRDWLIGGLIGSNRSYLRFASPRAGKETQADIKRKSQK